MKKKRNTKITRNNTFFFDNIHIHTHLYIGSNEINVKNDENFPIVTCVVCASTKRGKIQSHKIMQITVINIFSCYPSSFVPCFRFIRLSLVLTRNILEEWCKWVVLVLCGYLYHLLLLEVCTKHISLKYRYNFSSLLKQSFLIPYFVVCGSLKKWRNGRCFVRKFSFPT